MVSTNLFRALPPAPFRTGFDAEEDEPLLDSEEEPVPVPVAEAELVAVLCRRRAPWSAPPYPGAAGAASGAPPHASTAPP